MKIEKVLEEMYNISETMHSCVNGYRTVGDKFLYYGKICENGCEVERETGDVLVLGRIQDTYYKKPKERVIDFRNENVDKEIAAFAKNYIVERVNSFCKDNRNGDLQTMLIGCVLNLYYTSGLFDRMGRLSIEEITQYIIDSKTKEYVMCQEKLILSIVGSYFFSLCGKGLFSGEEASGLLKLYLASNSCEEKDQNLKKLLAEINPKAKRAIDFAERIIQSYDLFEKLMNKGETILKELYAKETSYQYAKVLMCIDGIKKFMESDSCGGNLSFLEYSESFEEKLFDIAIMGKRPSTYKSKFEKGRIVTEHPEIFSVFGLGIPHIECKTIEELVHEKIIEPVDEIDVCDSNYIRKGLEAAIGLPRVILVSDDRVSKPIRLALELNKSKKERDKALEDRKKVVNQFSHTYKNMRATSLYNIAMELIKKEETEFKNYGRKLLYEYSVKKNLTRDVEMLTLRFEDRKQELCDKIKSSIILETEDGVSIEKIINDALIRCMVTLVHDGGQRAKRLRARFDNYDWIEIRNNFEQDILITENKNVIEWFKQNMFCMDYEISELWKTIIFEDDSYAALLLTDILAELMVNIFKYADKTQPVKFEFTESENNMLIVAKNYINKNVVKDNEGGYGLEAEGDTIQVLNEMNGSEEEAMEIKCENGMFVVGIRIDRKVFRK